MDRFPENTVRGVFRVPGVGTVHYVHELAAAGSGPAGTALRKATL
jgi:hypothetical protein